MGKFSVRCSLTNRFRLINIEIEAYERGGEVSSEKSDNIQTKAMQMDKISQRRLEWIIADANNLPTNI